ncbi:MAG: hypothetical protein JSV80_17975 [Acidobacteriota bacterium]|nr:MAG: hypothetical protein JSV80_17975 [Acidobacteriota bacterium]
MSRVLIALLVLAAASTPQLAAKKARKPPTLAVEVTQRPSPARPGESVEVDVAVRPPEGIVLNRFPGLTLELEKIDGLTTDQPSAFAGSREPIEDASQAYFKKPEPLTFRFVPERSGRSERKARGTLKFFYCVKASGFCAPGKQQVSVPVKVSAR